MATSTLYSGDGYGSNTSYEYDEARIEGSSQTYVLPVGAVRLGAGESGQYQYEVEHVGNEPLDVEIRFDTEQLFDHVLPDGESSYVEIYVEEFDRWRSLAEVGTTPIFSGEVLPGQTYTYTFELRINEAASDAWSSVTFNPQLLSTVSKQN